MDVTTCCFTGHRQLPATKIEAMLKRLNEEVDNLIHQGVTDFISGGAVGFDTLTASLIIAKREMGYPVKLILALPCRNQNKFWSSEQTKLYKKIIAAADEIRYTSIEYSFDCMKKRNQYMVDQSAFCICCLIQNKGGRSTQSAMQSKKVSKLLI